MEIVHEEWRAVDGWPYEISNQGRVKSLNRNRNGRFGCVRRGVINKWGYEAIVLCKDGSHKSFTVHSLVAAAFIGPRPEKMDINHIDGRKANNVVSNLEYVTRKQNCRHAFDIGLSTRVRGEMNPTAKLRDSDVLGIKKLLRTKSMTIVEIGSLFGVSKSLVGAIKNQQVWSHVA